MTDPHTDPGADIIAALLADTSPYLSCDECFDRINEYVERRITDPHYDPAMRVHLAGCGACAEEAAALHELLDGPRQ
ncbi:hypothetical protein [Nocardia cyriacigeorgica]|uniref:hypothetical protein n=1 Tax=Nocardia cyriacigeorgica TaxID=135487 RepID=UPI001895C6CE|nr:hypothetical protein [Nocardia cyriacigeorgica]MBF6413916.1 hypothetical protein [Nocardia cyriacigeorgica]